MPSAPTTPRLRQLLITRAQLARRVGRSKQLITKLCTGALAPACEGRRIDAAHPVLHTYAREVWGIEPAQLLSDERIAPEPKASELVITETAEPVQRAAKRLRLSAEELITALEGPLREAVVPPGHVSAEEFTARAEVSLAVVERAARGELAPAVTPSGRIDLGHPAALRFLADRPFKRDRAGELKVPTVRRAGFLAAACVGEQVDAEHPVALAFLARACGYAPTPGDIDRMLAPDEGGDAA